VRPAVEVKTKDTFKSVRPTELNLRELLSTAKQYSAINLKSSWAEMSDDDDSFLKPTVKTTEGEDEKKSKDEKTETVRLLKEQNLVLKGAVRSMFKRDHPYRTRLGISINQSTSAAGVVNFTFGNADIATVSEWSSIDALFDEVFIHSQTLHFFPHNVGGGAPTAGALNPYLVNVSSQPGKVVTAGLICASLFHGGPTYSSAQAMLSNPSHRQVTSDKRFVYAWRNNERFDPRGPGLSSSTGEAWQGWTLISNTSVYGGTIQIRSNADVVVGDGTNAYNLGTINRIFDCSFRARA